MLSWLSINRKNWQSMHFFLPCFAASAWSLVSWVMLGSAYIAAHVLFIAAHALFIAAHVLFTRRRCFLRFNETFSCSVPPQELIAIDERIRKFFKETFCWQQNKDGAVSGCVWKQKAKIIFRLKIHDFQQSTLSVWNNLTEKMINVELIIMLTITSADSVIITSNKNFWTLSFVWYLSKEILLKQWIRHQHLIQNICFAC